MKNNGNLGRRLCGPGIFWTLTCFFFFFSPGSNGKAQVSIPALGTTLTEDFNSLAITGTSNVLPLGWALSESGANGDDTYAAGTGSNTAGNTYSFGANNDSERAFGCLQSGTLIPSIGAAYTNNSGSTIGILDISYTGEEWRCGALTRLDRLDFQYSLNATSLTTGTWINVDGLDFSSPNPGGPVGALNGNLPGNQTMLSYSITGLNIAPGSTFWIRWLDFNPSGSDDGLAVDNFNLTACPNISCPNNIGVCILNPPFPLTGGVPSGGTYSGTGVSGGMFSPNVAGLGDHEVTYTYISGTCNLSCTFLVSVYSSTVEAGTYGPVCLTDPNVQLFGTPPGGTWTGYGIVNGDEFDPNAGTRTLTYTYSDANGCSGSDNTTITVDSCIMPPEMRWVLLNENGEVHGSCNSQTNCSNNIICFGLQYTPNVNGTLTSYTTGFFVDCYQGSNPVLSQQSCVMNNASQFTALCGSVGEVLWQFSGNSGNVAILQNHPKILHQVCFTIPAGGSINLIEDETTDLTTSVDLTGGGAASEFPFYQDFSFSGSVYCALLPVTWLKFEASAFGTLATQLDWSTADELNNDYFEIQRSNDAGHTFLPIGRVESDLHPRDVNKYQYIDYEARPGLNYYRLKQYDVDGKFQYSPVRYVRFTSDAFGLRVYPNPVSEALTLEVEGAAESGHWTLIDLTGKTQLSGDFAPGASISYVNVRTLAAGVYNLVVESSESIKTEKIVIMK